MQKPMEGRTAVVFGVANKRSIAWGIAQAMQAAGARLAITYQNERLEAEAKDLITALPGAEAFRCDVSNDLEIDHLFAELKERFRAEGERLGVRVYAQREDLFNAMHRI